MTLQGALRFDHAWSYFPEQTVGRVAIPADADSCSRAPTASTAINDITPRGGVAYDLFGNGKTSLKVNAGKYLEAATTRRLLVAQSGPRIAQPARRPPRRRGLDRREQQLRARLRSAQSTRTGSAPRAAVISAAS